MFTDEKIAEFCNFLVGNSTNCRMSWIDREYRGYVSILNDFGMLNIVDNRIVITQGMFSLVNKLKMQGVIHG